MKTIFALATALFVGSAFAQQPNNPKHMFEFNVDSVLQGFFSVDSSKSRGAESDNDTQLNLNLNYAYQLPVAQRFQLGGRLDYNKDSLAGRGDFEDYGFEVGAFYNFSSDEQVDLMKSYYASLFVGLNWANNYSGVGERDDEVFTTTLAVGKRIPLHEYIGIDHFVYTPEIALESSNSTTGGALEYSQNLQFRFLQFAVFF